MQIITKFLEFDSNGFCDIKDITDDVSRILKDSNLREGSALIFSIGSTTGITTIEYEPGLLKDYSALMEKLIPSNIDYKHDMTWGDGNGFSHLRSSLQKTSLTIPFFDGKLILGTWQQIIFIDFDNKKRKRKVIVQLIGL
jgi:secondary thiamine-phosphate synthase enzyme